MCVCLDVFVRACVSLSACACVLAEMNMFAFTYMHAHCVRKFICRCISVLLANPTSSCMSCAAEHGPRVLFLCQGHLHTRC